MKSKRSPESLLARLLGVARRRGDDYSLVLNRFGLERLLDRLAHSRHADRFLLKGALLFCCGTTNTAPREMPICSVMARMTSST